MKTLLTASALSLLVAACTRPAADPPGIEEQPKTHHIERNPALLPTTSAPTNPLPAEDPATAPVQDPIGEGTVRTPKYVDDVPAPQR